MTLAEENYLKTIYHLEKQHKDGVPTNALSQKMSTQASSVTDMVKRLADKALLAYQPYQGVTLTKTGKKHALKVIRKHRLWEFFLVEKLHFSWDEVHELAEQLEHIQSEKLTNRLDAFLNFPKTDPHGDPIPDREGNFPTSDKVLLTNCAVGDCGDFVGVNDSSKAFLQHLDKQGIALGDPIEIIDKEDFDESMKIKIGTQQIHISEKTAANIFVNLKSAQ